MNTVERIISICKERKIPISTLEKSCGFSNGYIAGLKKGFLPDDRLAKVADFLEVDIYTLQGRTIEAASVIKKISDTIIENKMPEDQRKIAIWEKYEADPVFMENIKILFYLPRPYQNSVYEQIEFQHMKAMQGKNASLDA